MATSVGVGSLDCQEKRHWKQGLAEIGSAKIVAVALKTMSVLGSQFSRKTM
jgi:hypothetical protein